MDTLYKRMLPPLTLFFAGRTRLNKISPRKDIFLLFWLMLSLAAIEAQAQFTVPQIISSESTCQANGKVVVKGNVTYLNILTGGSIPGQLGPLSGSELDVVFNLLAPGNYTLTVIDPSTNEERQYPVSVGGNYQQNWIFSADVQYTPCSGGIPTVNISNLTIVGASPSEQRPGYFFRISSKDGGLPADGTEPPTYSTPLSGSFSIPYPSGIGGNYEIQGKDACGNYKTINVTVPASTPGPGVYDNFVKFLNCDGDAQYKINAYGGTAPYIFKIKSGPDQVGVTITDPSAATFNLKGLGTYIFEVKDQCGGTSDYQMTVKPYTNPVAYCWNAYGECDPAGSGAGTGSIQVAVDLNSIAIGPVTVSLSNTCGASNPAPQTYPTDGNTVTFTGLYRPCTYTVTVTDGCGKTFTKDASLVGPAAGSLQCYKYFLCPNDGSTDYRLAIGLGGTAYNAKPPFNFELIDSTTNAPVAGFPQIANGYTEIYPSLPKGKYYIKITDACGATCLDSVYVPKYSLPTVTVDVSNKCFGSGQANVIGINNRENLYGYGDYYDYWIESGPSRVGEHSEPGAPAKTGQFSGLISGGTYKFAFSDGCKVVYVEVTIPTYEQPTWEVGFGALCPPRTVASLQIMNLQPAGKVVGPYTWRIIGTDSPLYNSTAPYNGTLPYPNSLGQTDSTFAGLPAQDVAGTVATYQIQGVDGCKNSYLGSGKIGVLPEEALILDKTVVCPDGKSSIRARVSIPVVGATYVYYRDGVKIAQSTKLFTNLTPALPGTYTVKVFPIFNTDTTCFKVATAVVTGSGTLVVAKDSLTCAKRTSDLTTLTAGSSAGTITYYKDRDLTQAVPNPASVTEAGIYFFQLIPDGVANCAIVDSLVLLDQCRGSLGNYVWKDANDNGIQDATEKGVKGVIVQLLNASATVIKTDTTDIDGLYTFEGLTSGNYQVKIVLTSLPDTCQITSKKDAGTPNDDTNDSDFDSNSGLSQIVTIDATKTGIDKDNPTIDAGLINPCVKPLAGKDTSLCQGIVSIDLKDAGTKESWSSWSQNAAGVTIDASTGVVAGLSTTGDYFFILTYNNNATCADTVKVTVNQKPVGVDVTGGNAICTGIAKTALTATPVGGTWSFLDGPSTATVSGDTAKALTAVGTYRFIYTLATGCSDTVSVETKNCAKGSLGDFVWKDANDNGIQDLPAEKGVPGVILQLVNATTNAVLATDTTDAAGIYSFTGLESGDYKVKIVLTSLPDTCQISKKQDAGTPNDDTNDSDFNFATGESQVVTINTLGTGIAKDNPTIDAALFVPCIKPAAGKDTSLCQGTTTVDLKDASANEAWSKGTQPAGTSATINTSTGVVTGLSAAGVYEFILTYKANAACSDTVKVTVNQKPVGVDVTGGNAICTGIAKTALTATPIGGTWSFLDGPSTATVSGDTAKALTAVGTYRFIYTLATGCSDTVSVETKNCAKGSLGDLVWKDTNDNGIQDLPSEKGVPGVILQLVNATTNAVLATDTTDAAGIYSFTGLESGDYKVKILLTSLPDTCQISKKQDAGTPNDDTNDSDFNFATGESQVVTINTLGTGLAKDNPTIDAALVVPCTKSKVTLTGAPVCSADVQTYSVTFNLTNKVGIVKVNKGTLTGSNPYTVTGVPSGATLTITDSLSAVCKFDTLITGPNCNCNPPVPILLAPSLTACIGDTFPTIKAMVVGLATVEWFTTASGGVPVFTGLNYKPAGTIAGDTVFYAQARSTDPTCPSAISTTRVPATVNAQNCTKIVDLALKKYINTKIAQIGDELTYTIKVFNQSNTAATGVEVTDSIATTVQFVAGSFVPSRGSATITGSVIKWTIGGIAANPGTNGDTVTLVYKVKATLEGVHFNTAEISKTNEKDVDSTPGNGKEGEDDIDRQCFTVPVKLCAGEKVEASVPAKYTNVQWFKNGGTTAVATGNVVLLTEVGTYTFTATNQTCPAGGCCPVIIEPGVNCCPEELCIPFTIKQTKKGKK